MVLKDAFQFINCDTCGAHIGRLTSKLALEVDTHVQDWGSFDWVRDPDALKAVGTYGPPEYPLSIRSQTR